MKHIERLVVKRSNIILSGIIFCCLSGQTFADATNEAPTRVRHRFDSNAVARAKEILAFDEHEKVAPRYHAAITNWEPIFRGCGGITNFVELTGGEGTRCFRGNEGDRWVSISVDYLESSRDAHEYLVKRRSNPSTERSQVDAAIKEGEITDPKERIGFRCFRTFHGVGDIAEHIVFIRNNLCVWIFGMNVRVEALARDLDRQLLELSEEVPSN